MTFSIPVCVPSGVGVTVGVEVLLADPTPHADRRVISPTIPVIENKKSSGIFRHLIIDS
jgi:hypothetical protein